MHFQFRSAAAFCSARVITCTKHARARVQGESLCLSGLPPPPRRPQGYAGKKSAGTPYTREHNTYTHGRSHVRTLRDHDTVAPRGVPSLIRGSSVDIRNLVFFFFFRRREIRAKNQLPRLGVFYSLLLGRQYTRVITCIVSHGVTRWRSKNSYALSFFQLNKTIINNFPSRFYGLRTDNKIKSFAQLKVRHIFFN